MHNTSPRMQNEILTICKLLTDSSNKEQLSLSLRYVTNKGINESFVGFFKLDEGVTAESIAALERTSILR